MNIILAEKPFLSIQWEWPYVWTPAIFIRFYGCNLNCKWCDSKYAVNNPESLCKYTVDSLVNEIYTFNCSHIVFTWWEPTLFEKAIKELMEELPDTFFYELETNWSRKPELSYDHINCSPKLANSWNKEYELKVKPYYNTIYKFVAKTRDDCYEIQAYIEKYQLKSWNNIFIMPEWIDEESQKNWDVLQFCLTYWYRYCLRQHILLFWNKKWV